VEAISYFIARLTMSAIAVENAESSDESKIVSTRIIEQTAKAG